MTTFVYIDAANIIFSARDAGIDFDFSKLIIYLREKYKSDKIIYFTAKFKDYEELYIRLNELNVEIIFKESYRENNRLKANCDVEISHFMTKHIENKKVDKIVIASGDGDFSILLDYAKSKIDSARCFSVAPQYTSKMLKNKKYLEIIYMIDILHHIKKEIPDTD